MSKKTTYGESAPYEDDIAKGLEQGSAGEIATDPAAAPAPAAEPKAPGDNSAAIKVVIDAMKADGSQSALNCLYHLNCAYEIVRIHEALTGT